MTYAQFRFFFSKKSENESIIQQSILGIIILYSQGNNKQKDTKKSILLWKNTKKDGMFK